MTICMLQLAPEVPYVTHQQDKVSKSWN